MSIPKHDEVYREVLESLADGAEHKIGDVRDYVARIKNTTEVERSKLLKSGISVFDSRVGWSRTYLKAAGLVNYPKRGITQITENGKIALLSGNPINTEYLSQFESFRSFYGRTAITESGTTSHDEQGRYELTPQESIDTAFSQMNSSLGDELLTEIMNHEPKFFERLVVDLLVKMGYGGVIEDAGTVTPTSHDEGIDGIIREDKLGFSNIFIQAKRYSFDRTVSRPEIQSFVGAIINKGSKGLFITTAKFSDGAKSYAKENHIVLVDGVKLAELMIENNLGVSTVQTLVVKKMDSDYFTEY